MNNYTYSVLVCTYNGERYVAEQLESILEQSLTFQEIIISDDGSTDDTIKVIKSFFKQRKIESYRFIDGPRSGVLRNFLNGVIQCRSDYLFISDQDDVWHPGRVERYSKLFSKTNMPHLIFSDAKVVNKDLELISNSFIDYQCLNPNIVLDDSILLTNCAQGATCCINSSLINEIKKLNDCNSLDNFIIHDWLFVLLAKYLGKVDFIEASTIDYRQHEHNIIGAKNRNNQSKWIRYLKSPYMYFGSALKVVKQSYAIANYLGLDCSSIKMKNVEPLKVVIYKAGILFKLNYFFR